MTAPSPSRWVFAVFVAMLTFVAFKGIRVYDAQTGWEEDTRHMCRTGANIVANGMVASPESTSLAGTVTDSFRAWALAVIDGGEISAAARVAPDGSVLCVLPDTAWAASMVAPAENQREPAESEQPPVQSDAAPYQRFEAKVLGYPGAYERERVVLLARAPSLSNAAMMSRADWGILSGIIGVALAATLAFASIESRRGNRDLRALVRSERVSELKWRKALPVRRKDDIGHIARTLEAMACELDDTRHQLGAIKRSLDERVAERVRQINAMLRRAEQQAWMDPLTKLGNRRLLEDRLEDVFRAQRKAGDDLTIVMIDVDRFKELNDTLGHAAGDQLLSQVGDLIRGCIRATDIGIRYGGDEFAILLLGVGAEEASAAADRLAKLFAQQVMGLHMNPKPSMSIGIAAVSTVTVTTGESLLAKADAALYDSKRGGRNRITIYGRQVASRKSA